MQLLQAKRGHRGPGKIHFIHSKDPEGLTAWCDKERAISGTIIEGNIYNVTCKNCL